MLEAESDLQVRRSEEVDVVMTNFVSCLTFRADLDMVVAISYRLYFEAEDQTR